MKWRGGLVFVRQWGNWAVYRHDGVADVIHVPSQKIALRGVAARDAGSIAREFAEQFPGEIGDEFTTHRMAATISRVMAKAVQP